MGKKIILLVLLIFSVVFIFGCVDVNQNIVEKAREIPEVKDFLDRYPDYRMQIQLLSKETIEADTEFLELCTGVEANQYYKVTFSDKESNAEVIVFVDKEVGVVCSYTINKEIDENCMEDWSCTDFAPSTCPEEEYQERVCVDTKQCGSDVNKPTEQKVCDYIEEECTEQWSCGPWGECNNDTQLRECIDLSECGTETNKPNTTFACTETCNENWTCSDWGTCTNSLQSRTCTDSASCGTTAAKPTVSQACTNTCTENWICGQWADCANDSQTRTCIDSGDCNTTLNKPILQQQCSDVCSVDATDCGLEFDSILYGVVSSSQVWNGYGYSLQKTCEVNPTGCTVNCSGTIWSFEQQGCSVVNEVYDCTMGWTCYDNSSKIYVNSDCEYSQYGACANGCVDGVCQEPYDPNKVFVGEEIEVTGVGTYAGKTLKIKLDDLIYTGVNEPYATQWILKDGLTEIKQIQQTPPFDLKDEFGSGYFKDSVTVVVAGLRLSDNAYFAEIDQYLPFEIRNGQVFPYDSTQTTNPQWKAYITSNGTEIEKIEIKNNWSYNQTKTESSNGKFALQEGDILNLPQNYLSIVYEGLENNPTKSASIGGDNLVITDTKSVVRTIPLVISLGQGTNNFSISGNTYTLDVNTPKDKVRYWRKPTATVTDPYNNPTGTYNVDYFDVNYLNQNVKTSQKISFQIDSDWLSGDVDYVIAADEMSGQYWLFLASQDFSMFNSTIIFDKTYFDDGSSVPYYLPDSSTYNVLSSAGYPRSPSDGDIYSFTAKWALEDGDHLDFFVNTSTGLLVNASDGKARVSGASHEVTSGYFWYLDEYSAYSAAKLMQGYTHKGTKVTVLNGVATIKVPTSQNMVISKLYKGTSLLQTNENSIIYTSESMVEGNYKETYRDAVYMEAVSYDVIPDLQIIADGISPGDIILKMNNSYIVYLVGFINPIPFDSATTITILGKNYKIREATAIKLVLEEI